MHAAVSQCIILNSVDFDIENYPRTRIRIDQVKRLFRANWEGVVDANYGVLRYKYKVLSCSL